MSRDQNILPTCSHCNAVHRRLACHRRGRGCGRCSGLNPWLWARRRRALGQRAWRRRARGWRARRRRARSQRPRRLWPRRRRAWRRHARAVHRGLGARWRARSQRRACVQSGLVDYDSCLSAFCPLSSLPGRLQQAEQSGRFGGRCGGWTAVGRGARTFPLYFITFC